MTETYTVVKEEKWFGVWVPGEGWLRGAGNKEFADTNLEKAKQVARLIGRGATVRFIDKSIIDLESRYLEHERKSLWHSLKILLKRQ